MSADAAWAIGVDMGGTFIDVVACDDTGRLLSLKHPREAGGRVAPVIAAIERICAENGIAPRRVARIVHGSTVVTNLLLEQDAPAVAVLATVGMRDVLALARQERRELYLPVIARPTPEARLFPEHLRFEVGGRIAADGSQAHPLSTEGLEEIALAIEDAVGRTGLRAVAVCLLFAHRNPAHEQQLRQWLRARLPTLMVSLSSEVDPRPREFERFLTTALDAYAKPMVADYLRELAGALVERGLPEPWLMRSEGGIGAWRDLAARPVALAMSGPCAALEGVAASLGPVAGPVMAIDVGGTSTDIGLIEHGRPVFGESLHIGELVLRLRCADVESLSIGGGSIVRVLAGGALRLGPRSQGAWPGPAAYGQGGLSATLTDALCVLGRLPRRLAGGVALDHAAAASAIHRDAASPLGITCVEAAGAIVRTAATAMAEALKTRSFQRGLDPADGLLVAAGGGGAQHAAEVAELAGMDRVRVLPFAGVIAALGMLGAVPTETVERACEGVLDAARLCDLRALARQLSQGNPGASGSWSLGLCHAGQGFAIELPWDTEADTVASLEQCFEQRHTQLRGAASGGQALQLRTLRAVFEQTAPQPAPGPGQGTGAWAGMEPEGLGPRALFAPMTTVWVPRGWRWFLMPDDCLALERAT